VLDLDGLLIDSETWSWQAHNEALRRLNVAPLQLHEVRALVGLDADAEWRMLRALRNVPSTQEAYAEASRSAFRALRERSIAPMPGTMELLDVVARRRLGLGLASNSPRGSILRALDALGVRDRFGAIVSVDDVAHGKPAPYVYQLALERLGAAARRALAIEDSATGIAAACAAGMSCIAVPNALTAAQDLSRADVRLDSLHDVALLLATHAGEASR
jgi:HAD superfamily hydrolase (TIGR01509 family)